MRRILILSLLTTGAICLQAALYSAVKIDLDGRKDDVAVAFTNNDPGLDIFHPGWVKPEAKRNCYLQITGKKELTDKWRNFEFSFTPQKSGNIRICLLGRNQFDKTTRKRKRLWTLYDDIKLTGATLRNGDFSQFDKKGKFTDWYNWHGAKPRFEKDGEISAAAWHDNALNQLIKVTAGKKVTVLFKAKAVSEPDVEKYTKVAVQKQVSEKELEDNARQKLAQVKSEIKILAAKKINIEPEKITVKIAEFFLNGWIEEDRKNMPRYKKFYIERYKNFGNADEIYKNLPRRELTEVNRILDKALTDLKKIEKKPSLRTGFPAIEDITAKGLELKNGYFYKNGKPVLLSDANWSREETPLQFIECVSATPFHFFDENMNLKTDKINERKEKIKTIKDQMFAVWMTPIIPDLSKKYPGIMDSDGKPYCNFDIDHPAAKKIWEKFFAVMVPMFKDHPNMFGYHLANEPHWTKPKKTKYFYIKYRKYLKNKYKTIADLNQAWGKSYKNFDEIKNHPMPEKGHQAISGNKKEWFDFCDFNQNRVTDFFKFMHAQIKKYHPEARTYIKTSNSPTILGKRSASRFFLMNKRNPPDVPLEFSRHCNGIDREALTDILEINGCDTSLNLSPHYVVRSTLNNTPEMYALCWLEQSLAFDFMKSLAPDKLLLDDEWHAQSTVFFREPSLPPEYMELSLWLGHLHGMGANEVWHWGRSSHGRRLVKDLIDSFCMQPVTMNAYYHGMLQLNARSNEVVALANTPRQIRILYSEPSAIIDLDFLDTNLAAYQAAYFHGDSIGYITERQLAKRDIDRDCKLLIVPHVKYVSDNTVAKIKKFITKGGKVLFIGKDNLAFDHNVNARDKKALAFMTGQTEIPAMHPKKMHEAVAGLIRKYNLQNAVNASSMFGVRVQSADYKGKKLIFITNLLSKPVTVDKLNGAPAILENLLTGEQEKSSGIKLKPMQIKLYRSI